jgi:hemerythrin-like metal-binding protein
VVADEVRKLAEQSHQATEKISTEILEIQKDTEDAVELMNVGVAESVKGVEAVTQNGVMFEEITANITKLTNEMQRITTETRELTDSSKIVKTSADALDEICSNTSGAVKNIADGSQKQSAGIVEVVKASKRLSSIAVEMQKQIARFSIYEVMWSDDLETGEERIDSQHRQLVETVGELLKACKNKEDSATTGKTLGFLADYTVKHFQDEEKLQLEYGYPGYENHKRMHEDFKATVVDLISRYKKRPSPIDLGEKVNSIIVRWLISHIRREDSKIAAHIRKKRGKVALKAPRT